MPLEKRTLHVPITRGLETKVDPKQAQIGSLLTCENADFSAPGKLKKRKGFSRLTAAGIYDRGGSAEIQYQRYCFSRENTAYRYSRLINASSETTNGWKWFGYDSASANTRLVEAGDFGPFKFSTQPYGRARFQNTCVDMAIIGEYTAIVAAGSSNVMLNTLLTIIHNPTGTIIKDEEPLYDSAGAHITAGFVKIFNVNDNLLIVSSDGTDIWLNRYQSPNFLATNATNIASDAHIGDDSWPIWDACIKLNRSGTLRYNLLIAYARDVAGNSRLRCMSYLHDLTLIDTYDDNTVEIDTAVFIFGNHFTNDVYVGYWDEVTHQLDYQTLTHSEAGAGYASKYVARLVDTFDHAAGHNIRGACGMAIANGTTAYLLVEDFNEDAYAVDHHEQINVYLLTQNAATAPVTGFFNIGIASKPFQIDQYMTTRDEWDYRTYFVGVYYSGTQSAYFLISWRDVVVGWAGAPLAKVIGPAAATSAVMLQGRAMESIFKSRTHPSTYAEVSLNNGNSANATRYHLCLPRLVGAQNLGADEYLSDACVVTLSPVWTNPATEDPDPTVFANCGPTTQLSGGVTLDCDGMVNELGFLLSPETPLFYREVAAGGHLENAGVYRYRAVYEWTDHEGQVHQSMPSPEFSRTIAAAGVITTLDLLVKSLGVGAYEKTSRVRIVLYRTLKNGASTDLFHRLPDRCTAANSPLGAAVYVISDNSTEAEIAVGPVLYTCPYTGGVPKYLENEPPPASWYVATFKDRLAIIHADDRRNLGFSKKRSLGKGTAFSSELVRRIERGEGDLVAAQEMDDNFVLFKGTSIYRIWGEGPDDTGLIGDWSEPVLVTSDAGCRDKASVILCERGILFMSYKGIYLLNRGLGLEYIGAPVESYNGDTIYRALLDQKQHRVIFLSHTYGNTESKFLIWDYLTGQWSTIRFQSSENYAADACIYGGRLAFIQAANYFLQASESSFDDVTGNAFALKIVTTGAHFAGISGYQVCWQINLTGEFKSAHTLNVKVYYDDEAGATDTLTWAVTAGPYEFRVIPSRQYCKSIKLEIYDSGQSGTRESFDLSGISFDIGVMPGLRKLRESLSK